MRCFTNDTFRTLLRTHVLEDAKGFYIEAEVLCAFAHGESLRKFAVCTPSNRFHALAYAAQWARLVRRYYAAHGTFPCFEDPVHEWRHGPKWQRRAAA